MRIRILPNNVILQLSGHLAGRLLGVLFFLMISISAQAQGEFVTIWETTSANQEIIIPTTGTGYNYTVDWGDGNTDTSQTGDATHTYVTSGRHQIKISGDFPRIYFAGSTFSNASRIEEVKQWGYQRWESMEGAFQGASNVTVTAQDNPNLNLVTSMESMFEDCAGLTSEDFTGWNTANVTTFKRLFYGASNFRGDINTWNTAKVTDMSEAFAEATNFSRSVKNWDVSSVTTMERMFSGVSSNNKNRFSQPVGDWDVSNVTNMKDMFKNSNFGQDLGQWDVSKVTDMSGMFANVNYNKYMAEWDVSNVTTMKDMFSGSLTFNQDLSAWDVSKVTDMSGMFAASIRFNQGISGWNTAMVTTMEDMFNGATAFDQNLADLVLTAVTNIDNMLDDSGMSQANYDLTLAGWTGQTVPNGLILGASGLEYCLSGTERLSLINDDGWTIDGDSRSCNATLTFTDVRANEDGGAFEVTLTLDAFVEGGLTVEVSTADGSATEGVDYTAVTSQVVTFNGTAGETQTFSITAFTDTEEESNETINVSMANLVTDVAVNSVDITDGGTITLLDDETESNLFITTWTTTATSLSVTIPTAGSGYNYRVDWGDGTAENNKSGDATHTYASVGDYQVKIIGAFPGIHLAEGTADNAALLKSIDQWGSNEWQSMEGAFSGAVNMVMTANDNPNLNAVTSMKEMFKNCKTFNSPVSNWNTGSVQDMEGVFEGAESFNQFIGEWSTYNAVTARRMFAGAEAFNQPLENWFGSSDRPITNLSEMFAGARAFNRPLEEWEMSTVTDMSGMFKDATAFNQDLSDWEVQSVKDFSEMFSGATTYNQNMGDWDVSAATNMEGMFADAEAFDQNISAWTVDNVTNMAALFKNAKAFNQSVNDWDVVKVTTMAGMFEGAMSFNQDLSGWEPNALTDLSTLFKGAIAFNQDLSEWTTGNVTNMSEAFSNADAFNQDLSTWTVTNVTDMSGMFSENDAFDQNLGGWNIGMVTTMANMFDGTPMSDTNYDNILEAWSAQSVQNGVVLGADGVKYCGSATARQSLIDDHSWSFVGDAAGCIANVLVADVRGNEDDGTVTVVLELEDAVAGGFSIDLSTADGTATAGADYTALTTQTVTFAGTAGEVQTLSISLTQDSDNEADETIIINLDNLVTNAGNEVTMPASITATIVNDDDESAFFIMTWETTTANEEMIIPTNGSGYDFRVDWGDGTVEAHLTDDPKHTYTTPGVHTVKIIGSFPWIFFSEQDEDGGDLGLKLRSIEQWGTNVWQTMEGAFEGASNMVINATDAPDLSQVVRMDQMFSDCHALTNEDFSGWDVSNVENMEELFVRTDNFNGNVSTWNTSSVTNMRELFEAAKSFNGDISGWNTSNVTDMGQMFQDATVFNQDLNGWDVSQVTNFSDMFETAEAFNQNLNSWNMSNATDLGDMFREAAVFNGNIISWDVSSVTDMNSLFANAALFNQDISGWDVSAVTDMKEMFDGAAVFSTDISGWDVSAVTDMEEMFEDTEVFNIDISGWNLASLTDASGMFKRAKVFNQDISVWNISKLDDLESMFEGATAFDQSLATWNISLVENMDALFDNSGMSQANYDATLIGWATQDIREKPTVGAQGLNYCFGLDARQTLIDDFDWDFDGDAQGCMATITIADVSGNEDDGNIAVILALDNPVIGGFTVEVSTANGTATAGTDYTAVTAQTVDFLGVAEERVAVLVPLTADAAVEGDMTFTVSMANLVTDTGNQVTITDEATATIKDDDDATDFFITTWETTRDATSVELTTIGEGYNFRIDWGDGTVEPNITGSLLHTYATAGTYTVTIFGAFPRILASGHLRSIEQWGNNPWTSMEDAFKGLNSGLTINATDAPDLSQATSLAKMFSDTDIGNPDFTNWDVSTITDMSELFNGSDFNGDISNWDVSNVTTLQGTFGGTSNFNNDISGWDVSSVTTLRSTFSSADAFNVDISGWDISNVTTLSSTFSNTTVFNQDISAWNTSNVTDLSATFSSSKAFNQPLNGWDVSNVITLDLTFGRSQAFNQDLDQWDVSSVVLFLRTFSDSETFNGDISTWDTSNGENFDGMFEDSEAFNSPIGDWDLTNATLIARMFREAEVFNQPINDWRFPKVTRTDEMFRRAPAFNQDLNDWEVGNVTDFSGMFEEADSFDGDISDWDVSNGVDFADMLDETSFSGDVSNWDVSKGERFSSMFGELENFNSDVSGWDMSNAKTISRMFKEALIFDQDLSSWQISNVGQISGAFQNSGLSIANYDALLISWSQQDVIAGLEVNSEGLQYCAGNEARQLLIDEKAWTINNDSPSCMAEVSIADVSANEDDGFINITLTLDSRVIGGFTVDAIIAAGTATAVTDYIGNGTQSVTFEGTAGETRTVGVMSIADIDDEEDETVVVSMDNLVTDATNEVTITDQGIITILNDDNDPPVATATAITGLTQVGQTLTGSYTYSDDENEPENGSTFQWYTGNDAPPATVYSGTGLEDYEFQFPADRSGQNAFLNVLDNAVYTQDFIAGSTDDISANVDVVFGLGIGFAAYPISFYDTDVNSLDDFNTKNATMMALTSLTPADLTSIVSGEDVITLIDNDAPTFIQERIELANAGPNNDGIGAVIAFELVPSRGSARGLIEVASIDFTAQTLTVNIYIGATGNQLVPISGATTATLVLTEDLVGENIFFGVIPANDESIGLESTSESVGPVQALPKVSFGQARANGLESSTTTEIEVTLDNAGLVANSVDYTVTGTATAGSDFTLAAGTLNFAAGDDSETISLSLIDDLLIENDETVVVTLSNPEQAVLSTEIVFTYTILSDDAAVTIEDVSQLEDGESFLITATLEGNVPGGFTLEIATADGSATIADSDYIALSGRTLTFNGTDGETQAFDISPEFDQKLEADETFTVSMGNLAGTTYAVVITDQATLTITNDDAAAITIADVSGNEGDGPITLTATLDNEVQGGFTVEVSTADGTATVSDGDYTALSGKILTFSGTAGEAQPFMVSPTNDLVIEADETLSVSLSDLSTSLAVDISDIATVTIANDDFNNAPTDITLSVSTIAENNALDATIGSLITTDMDAGDSHSYSLVTGTGDDDNASFIIDGADLKVNNTSFNFEDRTSYSIRVRTDDGNGGTFDKSFTIAVTNVNERPFTMSLTNNTISESDQAQEVGMLMTLDPDNGDTFTYEFVSGDQDSHNDQFVISGNTVRTAGAINFEEGASRDFRVKVTDAGGFTLEWPFSITIEDVVAEPVRDFTTNIPGGDVKNVFSPNGDGVNETWVIEDLLDNPFNEVKIFAQGGKLIYNKVNYTNDWAGTFRDDPVPDGTYYYEIVIFENAQSTSPARTIKGFLTIIRNR